MQLHLPRAVVTILLRLFIACLIFSMIVYFAVMFHAISYSAVVSFVLFAISATPL